jgi:hypothetical protein
MSGNKQKVLDVIASMYDDQIPMTRFLGIKPDFKVPRQNIEVMLMPGNPATPGDSEKMLENSTVYVDMLIMAGVLAIARPEKVTGEDGQTGPDQNTPTMIIAGEDYNTFIEETKEYIDTDNVIMRTLGLSRQDFDAIANEYKKIVSEINNIDDILERWSDLSPAVKMGIMRGVLLQRSIMAQTLINMRARTLPIIKHEQDTLAWIADLLGPENALQEAPE